MNTPQHAKIDLKSAIALDSLTDQCENMSRDIEAKFSDLLKARLDKYLQRESTEKDWRLCRLTGNIFYFEEEKLMYVVVGELEWDGINCEQEIRYIDY